MRRCKKITQEIDETELDIGYSFMTVEDMENEGYPQFHVYKRFGVVHPTPRLKTSNWGNYNIEPPFVFGDLVRGKSGCSKSLLAK